jgi:hypothetical protein
MHEHSPLVQLFERLAEILQDLMVDEFHPARRRHRTNHSGNAVHRQLKIELVCAEGVFRPSRLGNLLLQFFIGGVEFPWARRDMLVEVSGDAPVLAQQPRLLQHSGRLIRRDLENKPFRFGRKSRHPGSSDDAADPVVGPQTSGRDRQLGPADQHPCTGRPTWWRITQRHVDRLTDLSRPDSAVQRFRDSDNVEGWPALRIDQPYQCES